MQPTMQKQVSTLSDMQRQLEMIDIGSININNSMNSQLTNSIKNNDSDDDEEDAQMESIRSFWQQKVDRPKISLKFDLDETIERKRRERSLKRIEKLSTLDQRNMQGAGQFYMQGGTKRTASQLSSMSLNTTFLFSQYRNWFKINQRQAPQYYWEFGDKLKESDNSKLISLAIEFIEFGCSVCSGFGHSKSRCPTSKHLLGIKKHQTYSSNKINRSIEWVNTRVGKYADRWMLGDFIGATAWAQILLMREQKDVPSQRVLLSAYILGEDLYNIYAMQCIVCQGYGHVVKQLQRKVQRVKKDGTLTQIIGARQYDANGKIFLEYNEYCPTKGRMEEIVYASKTAQIRFRQLLQEHRAEQKTKNITTVYQGQEIADTKEVVKYINDMLEKGTDVWSQYELSPAEKQQQTALNDAVNDAGISVEAQQAAQQQVAATNPKLKAQLEIAKFLSACYSKLPKLAAIATREGQIKNEVEEEQLRLVEEDIKNINADIVKKEEEEGISAEVKKGLEKKKKQVVSVIFKLFKAKRDDEIDETWDIQKIPYITCSQTIGPARIKLLVDYLKDAYNFTGFAYTQPTNQVELTNLMRLEALGEHTLSLFRSEADSKKALTFWKQIRSVKPYQSDDFAKVDKIQNVADVSLPAKYVKFTDI